MVVIISATLTDDFEAGGGWWLMRCIASIIHDGLKDNHAGVLRATVP